MPKKSYLHKYSMESILDDLPLGLMIIHISGNIEYYNNKILNYYGLKDEDLNSKKIQDLIVNWEKVKSKIINREKIEKYEVELNSSENKLWLRLSADIMENEKEGIIALTFDDIKTKRRQKNRISDLGAVYTFDKIIGTSQNMKDTISYSKKISNSKSTVLITGESGTGKELFAQAIHNYSHRSREPFVVINSGAIPENLIESELFGYIEGAFTGAKKGGQKGKFEIANKGTIFLDEIGEMPYEMQTRLLRVLEEGIISRVGSTEQRYVDVRVIAASNRNLKEEIKKGNFREDLYYRLNVLPLELYPLRDKKEDIPVLIDFFMERIAHNLNKRPVKISETELEFLIDYNWPGNIRELENFIELTINIEKLPRKLGDQYLYPRNIKEEGIEDIKDYSLEEVEAYYIREILNKYDYNITKAASILNISRNTLYRKMDCYKIERPNI